MHRLKAVFISVYLAATAAGLIGAGVMLAGDPGRLGWWGVVLASTPPLLFFGRIFLASVARTAEWPGWLLGLGGAGTVIALFDALSWWPALVAATNGVLLTWLYLSWYSRFGDRATEALAPGAVIPAFELETLDGAGIDSRALTTSPALWLFFRGNWCPLCMAQIREVAADYRRLAARGVAVHLVSPQPQDHSRSLAQRFDAPMRFLRDVDNRAARQLGILDRGGLPAGFELLGYDADVPMPTVLITAPGGRIVYSDLTANYRVRPEPAAFLAALDAAGL